MLSDDNLATPVSFVVLMGRRVNTNRSDVGGAIKRRACFLQRQILRSKTLAQVVHRAKHAPPVVEGNRITQVVVPTARHDLLPDISSCSDECEMVAARQARQRRRDDDRVLVIHPDNLPDSS